MEPANDPTQSQHAADVESGQDSVQAMLDIFMRERGEPRDGFEPVPFWITLICGILLLFGGYYLGRYNENFSFTALDPPQPLSDEMKSARPEVAEPLPQTVADLLKIGAVRYNRVCSACHKPDGAGDPSNNVPPLDGSEWVVGPNASPTRLARIVLHGLGGPITVKGRTYQGAQMPPHYATMKDYEIASVLTYIRHSWSNRVEEPDTAPIITTAKVANARAKTGKRQPMTAPELLALPLDLVD